MTLESHLPRKQRLARYTASHHERYRRMALSLSRELRGRYHVRRLTPKKGDTVRVLSGSYKGREERVTKVDYRHYRLVLDNITVKKADGKMKQLPISPQHLLLTKLNLSDPWRRRVLNVTTPEGEEGAGESATAAPESPAPEGAQ